MARATIGGIDTYYETVGDGEPVVMLSPGGFDAALANWSRLDYYRRIELIERLRTRHRLILFDKREAGRSGGRVERLGWRHYAEQVVGLMDHLEIESAHLMGGCVGCSIACRVAVAWPDRVRSLVLLSPAGGARYRLKQHERFVRHAGWVSDHGLEALVELGRTTTATFSADPRVGPWGAVLRHQATVAEALLDLGLEDYLTLLAGTVRTMFDRDSVPGVEAEDLLTLDTRAMVVPGGDTSHAISAARYLEECLPNAAYWDVLARDHTPSTLIPRIQDFLSPGRTAT